MADTYLSDAQLAARYGVHRATIWRWTNTDPDFPQPVRLSPQCTRWKCSQVDAWEKAKADADA